MQRLGLEKAVMLAVLVSALGYFVDIFDLLLFSIVRVSSLRDLGVAEGDLLSVGIHLLNAQMIGLFLGGLFWGVLGDKYGRVSVLFGSILLYSVGNILNGFVTSVDQYALVRLFTGIGLAGELGLGVTLVTELMPKHVRGLGAVFISFVGIMGAGFAALVADRLGWRDAYIIGGALGLGLLLLRIKLCESGLYAKTAAGGDRKSRGDLRLFLKKPALLKKYLLVVLVGAPIWAGVGIFITFAPEFARDFGMVAIPSAGTAVLACYMTQSFANLGIGVLSQTLKSRKKAMLAAIGLLAAAILLYVTVRTESLNVFYALCAGVGVGCGYWAMFVQAGAEQFGTDLRATAATSIPNVVRGLVVPMTALFHALIPAFGVTNSGLLVMSGAIAVALAALWQLEETFHADLDYLEATA